MNNYTESILNDLENKENGSFQIKNENNHAVLAVFKPGKKWKACNQARCLSETKVI
jgi:hypothetical protein